MEILLAPFAGDRSNRLSQRLIDRFGSPSGVLAASRSQLEEAGGEDRDVCTLIWAARDLVETGLNEDLRSSQVDLRDSRLIQFLKLKLGARAKECLYVIFVDQGSRYIRAEYVGEGGRSGVETRFGQLFRRAFELRAAGFFLAHNHPSGSHLPSRKDIRTTKTIEETALRLDFIMHDHLIVTSTKVYSIRQERKL